VAEVLAWARENVKRRMTTLDVDAEASGSSARAARRRSSRATAASPRSICASVNDEVVHGIPASAS
jgi:methionine aminopeptidase